MRIFLSVVVSALTLSGCVSMYNVAGQFEDNGQPFFGTVTVFPTESGTLSITSQDGQIHCSGSSQVTKMSSSFSLIGTQGRATALCNDGRTFKIDFIQTSETGGHGQGIDTKGTIIQLYFDESEGLARSQLDQHRINALIQ